MAKYSFREVIPISIHASHVNTMVHSAPLSTYFSFPRDLVRELKESGRMRIFYYHIMGKKQRLREVKGYATGLTGAMFQYQRPFQDPPLLLSLANPLRDLLLNKRK